MSRVIRYNTINIDKNNIFTPEAAEVVQTVSVSQTTDEVLTEEDAQNLKSNLLLQASKEADSIIDAAKRTVIEMVSNAERDAQVRAEEIYEEIKQKAYDEGYAKGEKEVQKLINKAEQEVQNAIKEKDKMFKEAEPKMVDLVLKILEKLLGDTVEINNQVILNLIRQGINEATIIGEINIRVSQADFDTVIKSKDQIVAMAEGATNVEIIKDLSLKKSDCILETPFGNIDCSLENQFKSLKDNLYYILSNSR